MDKCQYDGCEYKAVIGYYCWKHKPYFGMYSKKDQRKLMIHNFIKKIMSIFSSE